MIEIDSTIIKNVMSGPMSVFLTTYKATINIILAFSLVTAIIILILNLVRLGVARDHPIARQAAIMGVLVSGICFGLLTIVGVLYVFLILLL